MTNKYLLKGDISGIQDFIFNVSSKKASKSLKARSFFIQKLSELALNYIMKQENLSKNDIIYNGGGNFYIEINDFDDVKLKQLQKYMNRQTRDYDFYISLSKVAYGDKKFGDVWKAVNHKSNLAKLTKHKNSDFHLFNAFSYEPQKQYISLDIIENDDFKLEIFGEDIKQLFKDEFKKLKEGKDTELFKNIPVWRQDLISDCSDIIKTISSQNGEKTPKENEIISFQYLAEFARKRTGTDLIGILKMDIDDLHLVFDGLTSKEDAIEKSGKFKVFFETTIFNLITDFEKETQKELSQYSYDLMINNIYPVFAGGDDCFFIGAWDYILDYARLVRKRFIEFEESEIQKGVTLSAALTLTDAHFPVIRFAEIVEDWLGKAKEFDRYANKSAKEKAAITETKTQMKNAKPYKNAINFMGEVVTWEELEKMTDIIDSLKPIIEETPAIRNLLHRISASAVDFNILQNNAVEGKMNFPQVWRLFYTVKRNIKSSAVRKEIEDKILTKYETTLLDAYTKKQTINPVIFPLAARWTELLTKNKN